jgi:hypothetical protein
MLKEYSISSYRRVCVKKQGDEFFVTIEEPSSELKTVTLPAKRWAALVATETQIEETLDLLQNQQYVKLNTHIGGGVYVSVTTGFKCVDIRRFYYNPIKESTLPTKEGIAINLNDWSTFKVIAQQINRDFPELAKTKICSHETFMELWNCNECHPFDLPTPV